MRIVLMQFGPRHRLPRIALAAIVLCAACAAAQAQSAIVIPGAGEITTTAKVDNGVLAISNQIIRSKSHVRECFGVCLYASKTVTKNWICRQSSCALDCSGREPIGGC
jgi:hypothetical protein